jgi:hypothetical protein
VPGPTTGIGPALREARETLGKRLEEASRDTRIKPEYLQALERESFDALGGDVYTRGFLRSYSAYLGLDPDKVVAAYAVALEAAAPESLDEPAEAPPPTQSKPIRKLHRTANWRLALLVAAILLASAAAAGLLSGNKAAPDAGTVAPSPTATGADALQDTGLAYVYLDATKVVGARVIVDGEEKFSGVLKPGKPQQFTASTVARVWFNEGGRVQVTVNGHDLGEPGAQGREFVASFTPQDYRETSSPAA